MAVTLNELLAMTPHLILIAGGLLVLVAQLLLKNEGRVRTTFSLASSAVALALLVVVFGLSDAAGIKTVLPRAFLGADKVSAFNNTFRYSAYSANALVLILTLALGALLLMRAILPRLGIDFAENHFFIIMSVVGYSYALCAEDLITLFVALELGTLPLIVLIGMNRESRAANEAAIKYLLLSAFAVAFFLLGIALIYAGSSTVRLHEIQQIGPHYTKTRVFVLAFIFMFSGFLFKLGAVPMHSYIADVYEGTTTVFTAVLASLSKVASVLVFLKVAMAIHDGYRSYLAPVFTAAAIASMLYGSLAASGTGNLKRALAYSSISHAGFMLCFFVIGASVDSGLIGTAKQEAGSALYIYAAGYAAASLLAFTAIAFMEQELKAEIVTLDNIATTSRGVRIALGLALLSFLGMPPLAGFFGKFFLFKYLALSANLALAAAVGLASAIAMYAYLRIIRALFFQDTESRGNADTGFPKNFEFRFLFAAAVSMIAFFALLSGFLYHTGVQAVQKIY